MVFLCKNNLASNSLEDYRSKNYLFANQLWPFFLVPDPIDKQSERIQNRYRYSVYVIHFYIMYGSEKSQKTGLLVN